MHVLQPLLVVFARAIHLMTRLDFDALQSRYHAFQPIDAAVGCFLRSDQLRQRHLVPGLLLLIPGVLLQDERHRPLDIHMHYREWITVDWRKRSSWRRAISAHWPELSSFK